MATSTIKNPLIAEQIFRRYCSEMGTTGTSFACNWQDYDFLIVASCQYSNITETIIVPKSYFSITAVGTRPIVCDSYNNVQYQVYQDGEGNVIARSTDGSSTVLNLRIYGIKFS